MEVVRGLNNAAKFSSLTVTEDLGISGHWTGWGVGYVAAGGLACDGNSAARILSAGVISKMNALEVDRTLREKTLGSAPPPSGHAA